MLALFKMNLVLVVCSVLFGLSSAVSKGDEPKLWALLVAGSNGWYNYRHQADVCHAYQILHAHGIPDERIVVMMYDDLAHNEANPTPGIVINHPDGHDVYHGVPKDYIGDNVTPENFLKVLQGQSEGMKNFGSGKVINSGPNDHVFVNFVDHGATGLVAFPNGELTAKQLNNALTSMHEQKKYAKMVLYIEACESGSMFRGLLRPDINIYATTASAYNESSYACYYDKKRGTYLGDWYSVHWMEDSDKENLKMETLLHQFKVVKSETNTSHAEEFGDMALNKLHVAEFQGEASAEPITYHPVEFEHGSPSYEAPLDILFKRRSYTTNPDERDHLNILIDEMIKKRVYVEEVYKSLVYKVTNSPNERLTLWKKHPKAINNWDCYEAVVKVFSQHCFNLGRNPYALKFVYVLVNLCETNMPVGDLTDMMADHCAFIKPVAGGIH